MNYQSSFLERTIKIAEQVPFVQTVSQTVERTRSLRSETGCEAARSEELLWNPPDPGSVQYLRQGLEVTGYTDKPHRKTFWQIEVVLIKWSLVINPVLPLLFTTIHSISTELQK